MPAVEPPTLFYSKSDKFVNTLNINQSHQVQGFGIGFTTVNNGYVVHVRFKLRKASEVIPYLPRLLPKLLVNDIAFLQCQAFFQR